MGVCTSLGICESDETNVEDEYVLLVGTSSVSTRLKSHHLSEYLQSRSNFLYFTFQPLCQQYKFCNYHWTEATLINFISRKAEGNDGVANAIFLDLPWNLLCYSKNKNTTAYNGSRIKRQEDSVNLLLFSLSCFCNLLQK